MSWWRAMRWFYCTCCTESAHLQWLHLKESFHPKNESAVRGSFRGHKKCLELQSKNHVAAFSFTTEIDGEERKCKIAPYILSGIIQVSRSPIIITLSSIFILAWTYPLTNCVLKGHSRRPIQRDFMFALSVLQVLWGQRSPKRTARVFCGEKRQDHSQTNNLPDPRSQRRTGPDNLTTFTTLSCTMQTVHFMNCRLYLNLVQHLSVICLDMLRSIWTRGFV